MKCMIIDLLTLNLELCLILHSRPPPSLVMIDWRQLVDSVKLAPIAISAMSSSDCGLSGILAGQRCIKCRVTLRVGLLA